MVRRVFFSFHYERDIWRANVVRNSWVTQDREEAGFWDASLWEEAKKKGDSALKRMINDGLEGTSVTVVLIGRETSSRKWVRYEVKKSYEEGKGMLGVYIHNIKDQNGNADVKGINLFGKLGEDEDGNPIYFVQKYQTYDWVDDDGYENLGDWVEKAAEEAGR